MNTYLIHWSANPSFAVSADDMEHAQEVAIELLESLDVVHSEIVGIVKVQGLPADGQFVGMSRDGMAAYINVSL